MRAVVNLAVLALLLIPAAAQTSTSDAQRARVFVTDSQSWQMTGNSVTPGDHTLTVSKSGFKSWERKFKATGGSVNIKAELEAQGK